MKRKKIVILGALIVVVSMVMLIMPLASLSAVGGGPTLPPPCDEGIVVDAPCVEVGAGTTTVTFKVTNDNGTFVSTRDWKLEVTGQSPVTFATGVPKGCQTRSTTMALGTGSYTAVFKESCGGGSGCSDGWRQKSTVDFKVVECTQPCTDGIVVDAPCVEEGSETATVTFTMQHDNGDSSHRDWKLELDGTEVWSEDNLSSGCQKRSTTADLGPGTYKAVFKVNEGQCGGCGYVEKDSKTFDVEECEPEIPPVTTTTTTTTTTAAAYTITASVDDHGTITDEGATSVSQGSSKAYSMDTVSTACGIVEVLVDGVSIGKVNSYTFDDVNADHTIHVITRCTPPAPVEEEIEVLGIAELPFTGQSMIFYILGFAMIAIAGGLVFALRAVKSKE